MRKPEGISLSPLANILISLDLAEKPCTRKGPESFRGRHGHPEFLSRLRLGKPGEEAEVDDLGGFRSHRLQTRQCFVQVQQPFFRHRQRDIDGIKGHMLDLSAAFLRLLPAGRFNKYPPHGMASRSKEMTAVFPGEDGIRTSEAQPGFVNQRCGLQRIGGCFTRQFGRSELPQVVIDDRQQLIRRLPVAPPNALEDLSEFAHGTVIPELLTRVKQRKTRDGKIVFFSL
jgi:hypothetical protein